MCDICNVERGDCAMLVGKTTDVMIGKAKCGEIGQEIFINYNEDGTWEIDATMDVYDHYEVVRLPIAYCPCCGRKLHEEEKTEYPWNKD